MVSRHEVESRYRSYVEDYPENTELAFESENDTKYPLRDRALGGNTFASVFRNQFANESAYLFELDDRVPSIHGLPVKLLPIVATELNRVLLVQITHDHLIFWEYTHQFISHEDTIGSEFPEYLVDMFSSVLELTHPDSNMTELEIGHRKEAAACYFGYPLLEAIAKWFASDYINFDGTIKTDREIRQLGGGTYGPPDDPNEADECSDIGSLLYHIEKEVAGPKLRNHLEETRRHIGKLYDVPSDEVYGGVIKDNRNTTLHGETRAPAEIGVILNLAGLLIWSNYVY